jgi:arylsulfatase
MKNFKFNSKFKSPQKGLLITALLAAQIGLAQNIPDANYKGVS